MAQKKYACYQCKISGESLTSPMCPFCGGMMTFEPRTTYPEKTVKIVWNEKVNEWMKNPLLFV